MLSLEIEPLPIWQFRFARRADLRVYSLSSRSDKTGPVKCDSQLAYINSADLEDLEYLPSTFVSVKYMCIPRQKDSVPEKKEKKTNTNRGNGLFLENSKSYKFVCTDFMLL